MKSFILAGSALYIAAPALSGQAASFDPTPENCAKVKAEEKKQPPKDPKAKASPEALACSQALLDRLDEASKAALAENEAELAAAKAKLEAVRNRAWRAPDGRPIYQDGQIWRYDDGTIVPPEIVAKKVPPPR